MRKKGIDTFLLSNKDDYKRYSELGTIPPEHEMYYEEDSPNSLNILNTTGKNDLSNQESLYLATLPVRPPVYYKQIAIALHKGKEPLDLTMNSRGGSGNDVWFQSPFIEKVYKEMLLSEIVQIIHRSNIRKLLVSNKKIVNIYITTNLHHIITELEKIYKPLGSKVIIQGKQYKEMLKLNMKIEEHVSILLQTISKMNTFLPASPRKITNNRSLESFINKNREKYESQIRSVFQGYKLDIKKDKHDRNRKKYML